MKKKKKERQAPQPAVQEDIFSPADGGEGSSDEESGSPIRSPIHSSSESEHDGDETHDAEDPSEEEEVSEAEGSEKSGNPSASETSGSEYSDRSQDDEYMSGSAR